MVYAINCMCGLIVFIIPIPIEELKFRTFTGVRLPFGCSQLETIREVKNDDYTTPVVLHRLII